MSQSETEKLQESVQTLEKTFQDLSVYLTSKAQPIQSSSIVDDTNFHDEDTAINQSSILQQDFSGLNGSSNQVSLQNQDDLQLDDLNLSSLTRRTRTFSNTSAHSSHRRHHTSRSSHSRRRSRNTAVSSDPLPRTKQREKDIQEISHLLLDLQDGEAFLDETSAKEHTKQAKVYAQQLVDLVKDAENMKGLDMDRETQFLRELDERLATSKVKPPKQPESSWEEVSMLRTQWLKDMNKPRSTTPPRIHKSAKELLMESQPNLQSPSRFDALQVRFEEPSFVEEFSESPTRNTRKALLVGVYNPQLPSTEESLKRMYNICRILNFDEIMVLDTKNGTRKGVILHYYNELLKGASSSDVRLFYMFGEAQLIYNDPCTYSFRDSTRRREVGVSRWDLGSTAHTSLVRIWDAILDRGFDEHVCEHTPFVSHVSCELTAATPREDLTLHAPSPFSNGLFEIVRWYAERRRICTNRSLKFQLRLMQKEGEFGNGVADFECFRSELDMEFTAVLQCAQEEDDPEDD